MFRPLLLVLGTVLVASIEAAVRLPAVIADHMVLQQSSTVKLWGWSDPAEAITITPSWDGHSYKTTATNLAKWEITLTTPSAGGPYTIRIEGSNEITLEDVMIGEVWICSGQSNMEWSANHGFDDSENVANAAQHPELRLFKIAKSTSAYPQEDCEASWEVCTPDHMRSFSAVAYFFGRRLQEELGVPVGLIQAAWGGTAAEVWTPPAVIEADAAFNKWESVLRGSPHWPRQPGSCYHAMIHPVTSFKIAGAIWYQGESNTANPVVYERLFPAMIESWRSAWQSPLPFYYVQIAPYKYGSPLVGAQVREAQLKSLRVPRTGMVVISDIGDNYDIHPRKKSDVGLRLANMALAKTYGKAEIAYCGPLYRDHTIEANGQVRLSFDCAEQGLLSEGPLEFELAGADRIFVPAVGQIEGQEVWVQSEFVLEPVAARYAYKNVVTPRLKNQKGLPASSFRTDDWPIRVHPIDISIAYKPEAEAYLVSLSSEEEVDQIKYSINGDPPGLVGLDYRQPFYIQGECTIKAVAFKDGFPSDHQIEKPVTLHLATYKPCRYLGSSYHPDRAAGGDQGLIDGRYGSTTMNDGNWQGFQNADLDLMIDFGRRIEVSSIAINALKNQNANVFLPNKVTFEISNDGQRFIEVFRRPLFHARESDIEIQPYEFAFKNSRKTRYIRVKAENVGECPSWHRNAGSPAWMLLDEITVK